MSEMIELVARAVCKANNIDPDNMVIPTRQLMVGPKGVFFCGPDPVPAWEIYVLDAKTAISAMRKPTKTMIKAMETDADTFVATHAWQTMIDAALKD